MARLTKTQSRNPHKRSKHRPAPQAIDVQTSRLGLRGIAVLEAIKGAAVLAAGFGVLTLLHKDAGDIAEHWVQKLHLNPHGHLSRVFLDAADKVTDARLWAAAGAALVYSTVRLVEAYGLWNARVWAEWFALLSGALYLPWEIYEVAVHPTPGKLGLFATNLIVVLYMLYVRVKASHKVPD
jgi:uncharacterized membrane protein (DUF2068 family)